MRERIWNICKGKDICKNVSKGVKKEWRISVRVETKPSGQ